MRRLWVVLVLLLAIVGGLAFLALSDGGVPPQTEGNARTYEPRLGDWSLTHAGEKICGARSSCDGVRLRALHNETCSWSASVWLAGTKLAIPIRMLNADAEAVLIATRLDDSHWTNTIPHEWSAPIWMRTQSVHLARSFQVPCDVSRLELSLNLRGTTMLGRETTENQGVHVVFDEPTTPRASR